MKARHVLIELKHFIVIQQVAFFTTTEYEVNIFMGNMVKIDVLHHTAKRRYARTGANKKEIFIYLCRQCKYTKRAPERKLRAYFYFIENIGCA